MWLVTAKVYMGAITVDTLSDLWVSFAGNSAAIISGGILSVGLSLWRPANFDWDKTKLMEGVKEDGPAPPPAAFVTSPPLSGDEKVDDEKDCAAVEDIEVDSLRQDAAAVDGLDIPALTRTFKKYTILFAVLATVITFVRVSSSPTITSSQPKFLLADYSRAAWGGSIHFLAQVLHSLCCRHVCRLHGEYIKIQS